jgi:RHS repeat-associated protein
MKTILSVVGLAATLVLAFPLPACAAGPGDHPLSTSPSGELRRPQTTPANTTATFYYWDHLGTVRMTAGENPTVETVERHDYEPYGLEMLPATNQAGNTHQFTGHERDALCGAPGVALDYMHFRYYGSSLGRFMRPDDHDGKPLNPQSWNKYTYVLNNPVGNIDPDGRDAIAIVFPNYKVETPVGKMALGHAGIVTIDSKGRTRYFEYGRYDPEKKGLVRERTVPAVVMKDGKPTQESLNALMKSVSQQAGHGGQIEGAYFKTTDQQTAQMNKYADAQAAQNTNPNREAYDLTDKNCATFMDKTIEAGGVNLPDDLSARPGQQVDPLQKAADSSITYNPQQGTTMTPTRRRPDELEPHQ